MGEAGRKIKLHPDPLAESLLMFTTLLACGLALAPGAAQQPDLLWPNGAPSSVGDPTANQPSLTAYAPAAGKANGTAVIVCPGGGYGNLALDHEGKQVADWLTARGVIAYVLRYRVAVSGRRPGPLHPAPMLDVQRAVRTVRAKAKDSGVRPDRIGVWGFSAGGHLASTAATHFDGGNPDAPDPIDRVSCRPDFAILAYPVITLDAATTHAGSRRNLVGADADAKLVEQMSNEKQVTRQTPPTFLFHTDEDRGVSALNSILFYQALKKNGVPAELHIYERGAHGVGLAPQNPVLSTWPDRLEAWLKGRGLLTAPAS
jgi:acetyl esterase/lipase